jgi:hypothetical protein
MDTRALVDQLRQQRRLTLAKLAPLDPARLQDARAWRGKPATLAHRLAWLAEGDDTRCVRISATRARLGAPLSVAQMALVSGGATRGRLLGTLVGVPEALRERPPAPGEWSVQRTLGHVIANDKRYRIAVEYALDRARSGRSGPLRPPDDALPPRTGEAESVGTWDAVLARLAATRDEVILALASTPDALLWDLDVRFRLHRFAAHDREHTIQIRRTLDALEFVPNEVHLLLADAEVARAALEAALLCTPSALLEQEPPGGGPAIGALVAESLEDERTI